MIDELTGIDKDRLIGYDYSGWPIYKCNLRDLLLQLGAKIENNIIGFDVDSIILNLYPVRVVDDGASYGVNEQWFIEANTDDKTYITIFTEKEFPKEKLDKWFEAQKQYAEAVKKYYDNRQLESIKE